MWNIFVSSCLDIDIFYITGYAHRAIVTIVLSIKKITVFTGVSNVYVKISFTYIDS